MNFIIFMPDELRADSLGCYGHPVVQTPNYDRLAQEGVRFSQCYVQHTVCTPSRCSMMTGWYPHVSGHRTLWNLLQPYEPNLFKYLKKAGYQVRWYGKNDLLSSGCMAESVDEAHRCGTMGPDVNAFKPGEPGYMSFLYEPFNGRVEEHLSYEDVWAGVRFLQSCPQEPFILYLPIDAPHPPYGAPPPYHDMYSPDSLPKLRPVCTEGKPDFHALIRRYRGLDRMDESVLQKIRSVYLGTVSFTDMLLGKVLDALDETGLANNTAVFVCSDHGDWAGDYGLVEKWSSALDDSIVHIPMIARVPGMASEYTVESPIELFDIMSTILELAEVDAEHTHFSQSMIPALRGAMPDPNRAVFAEGGYDPHEPHCFEGLPTRMSKRRSGETIYTPKYSQQQDYPESVCRSVMIRTLGHKLIRRTQGLSELYDLKKDPQELVNLYEDSQCAGIRHELEDRLFEWYLATSDVTRFHENPRGFSEFLTRNRSGTIRREDGCEWT